MNERNNLRTQIKSAITSAVSEISGRFYSTTDNQEQFPFITWGVIEQRPINDKKDIGTNVYDIQLDIWDRSKSPARTETILDKIQQKLHRNTITTSGDASTFYQTNSFYIYDTDPTIIHGIYRFRAEKE